MTDVNFKKWSKDRGKSQGHVRFSDKVMFVSSSLLSCVRKEFNHFDILVDEGKRLFGLNFGVSGDYKVTRMPGQFGVAGFVEQCKPVLGSRITMKRVADDANNTSWVGSMDGEDM